MKVCIYSKTCVKWPLKNRQNKDLNTNWQLNADRKYCWSILQYFSPDKWSWKPFFGLFESGRFTQVLLYYFCNYIFKIMNNKDAYQSAQMRKQNYWVLSLNVHMTLVVSFGMNLFLCLCWAFSYIVHSCPSVKLVARCPSFYQALIYFTHNCQIVYKFNLVICQNKDESNTTQATLLCYQYEQWVTYFCRNKFACFFKQAHVCLTILAWIQKLLSEGGLTLTTFSLGREDPNTIISGAIIDGATLNFVFCDFSGDLDHYC